jgi:thiamine transporter ThiT
MTILNPQKVGLALGSLVGLLHFLWSVLIALGVGQALVDWIYEVHMIEVSTVNVLPFSLSSAVVLVVVTFVIGNVVGYLFASIWNKVQE